MRRLEYIKELQKRVLTVISLFVVLFIIGMYYSPKFISLFLTSNLPDGVSLVTLNPYENIALYLNFVFFFSLTFTLPIAIYNLIKFIGPGLTDIEKKAAYYIPIIAFFLFLLGVLFGFVMIKFIVVPFLVDLSLQLNVVNMWSISQYFSFILYTSFMSGVLFQLPLVILGLVKFKVVKPDQISQYRRHVYFILIVVCAFVTPPDLFSLVIMFLPLFLLFEISLLIANIWN